MRGRLGGREEVNLATRERTAGKRGRSKARGCERVLVVVCCWGGWAVWGMEKGRSERALVKERGGAYADGEKNGVKEQGKTGTGLVFLGRSKRLTNGSRCDKIKIC